MAQDSPIEWTNKTWNPIRGCSRVSPGCGGPNHQGGCYAEKMAARFSKPGQAYHGLAERTPHGGRWTGVVRLIPEQLVAPIRWRKPAKIFVNSMSDLFHEGLTDDEIDQVFAVMALCPQHTFQILTKRSPRMRDHCADNYGAWAGRVFPHWARIAVQMWGTGFKEPQRLQFPLPNVWLGVSVEDQERANERIPDLLATPAAVRFLSCEPLLGPVDLEEIPHPLDKEIAPCSSCGTKVNINALTGDIYCECSCDAPTLPALDWVICGGESGPRKRPTDTTWHRFLRDQCKANGVAFFEKQIDKVRPVPEDLQVREFPVPA